MSDLPSYSSELERTLAVAERERDEARAALASLAAIIEARAVAGASATLADRLTNALDCRDAWSEQARKDAQRLAAERHRAEKAEAALADKRERWPDHCYRCERPCRYGGQEPETGAARCSECLRIGKLEAALAAERERAEKWRAEVCDALVISRAHGWKDCASVIRADRHRAEVAEQALAEVRKALLLSSAIGAGHYPECAAGKRGEPPSTTPDTKEAPGTQCSELCVAFQRALAAIDRALAPPVAGEEKADG